AVIAAGGAFGTPELLLRSGLRNREIGRNLRFHPAAWIGARFSEPVRGWQGVMQSYYVDEWQDQGLMLEATFTPLAFGAHWLPGVADAYQRRLAAYEHLGSNGVHLSDTSSGRIRLARDGTSRISYRLTRADARRLAFGIARAAEIWFAAGAEEVYPQIAGRPALRRGGLTAFESTVPRPHELRLEAFHPMGTARIAAASSPGVCDPNGAVRGVEGLYVADASLLPTSLGVNPMMTIIASSAAISRRMRDRIV
ncbi:MAG: GMC family oxidoreductase, partial [Solirubrobacterales bacterium]